MAVAAAVAITVEAAWQRATAAAIVTATATMMVYAVMLEGSVQGEVAAGVGACVGGSGDWSPSSIAPEQSLEREFTPFFLQMMTRVCGGIPSPLIEPQMGREGKGPLEAHDPKA